ncbi:cadherin-23 [Brachyhypopomus gauderio]|uniref:cadherin-23 n=1 Tax=Brachyhypopomus gauderio TaxID=698409 RepID=UPI004042B21C
MDNMNLSTCLAILTCLCVHSVWGAIGTSDINCVNESEQNVGSVIEGYEGDVETITNIPPTDTLVLESDVFPIGVTFLKLNFTPGAETATVQTTKALDADVLLGETLFYAVTCTNSGVKNKRTLKVEDINDNGPVFQSKQYKTEVSETLEVGNDVLKVIAVDVDILPQNHVVSYSILPPIPNEFEMRSDGNIRLIRRLNYNTVSLYNFVVVAKDPGDLQDTANVVISVIDFDNMNPYFDHSLYEASIPENELGPFSTLSPEAVKAQDGDTGINQPIVYSITTVNPVKYRSSFNIDPNSGVISVVQALDREEIDNIVIQIQAAQEDDSTKTAEAVVSVTVEDVNDNMPEFDQDKYTAVILENSPRDQFVLQVHITDLDKGGFMGTLQIIPDTVPFYIGSDNSIRVKSSTELDRETNRNFYFHIEAKDKAPSTDIAMAAVNISLSDENDNSPVFGTARYEGKVSADQTLGMLVVKVEATDLDEGPNGQISYFINIGNEEGYFHMDKHTGEITLNKTIPLMENKILQFLLYVSAQDGGTVSRFSSVLVDIKAPGNSNPQFLQKTYQGKVLEEQEAGTEIIKVAFLSLAPAVPVTLTINTEADKFSIDDLTGILSTKVKLDYENQKNYTVQVSLSDGTNHDEASVHVDVLDINDNSPEFSPSLISIDVPEDAAIGDNVTAVSATDRDTGLNAEVLYTLERSAGMFSVNPTTGLITIAAALDRESQDTYEMTAVARDQGRPSLSGEASVVVTVTDVNDNAPSFSHQQYEASVSENSTVGTDVISINATDKDEGPNAAVTYHITKQEPSLPLAFTVDATSGLIHLAQELDYSKVKKYTLEVEARDGGIPALTGSAVVKVWVEDLNDKAPEFSQDQYDVGVYENIASGSALVSLEVTDEDEGGFNNGHFLLSSDTFSINSQGVVHLRHNASLDRETQDHYMIQVVAVDQPVNGLSSTAHINITVLDVNDNNPQFVDLQNPLEIPEDARGEVYRIQVSDMDIGPNGEVFVFTSPHSDLFALTMDGILTVTGELDRETQEFYDLTIIAEDKGLPPRGNVTRMNIIVTDVNDNAPVFSQRSYSTRVLAKDAKAGDLVLTVTATDQDAGNNSIVTYRFSSASDLVDLNSETGDITWTKDLTHLKDDLDIDLIVIAEDHGIPPQNDTEANVMIQIRAVSLSDSLTFENSTYYFTIKENEPMETDVGGVKASTGSQLDQITYKLTSHTDLFSIDKSGTIKTLKMLDKEEQEWFITGVEASDTRTPPNTTMATVIIQVEDVNEAPVFDSKKYKAVVFSMAPFRFPVAAVKASDPDVGDGLVLHYSLAEPSSLLDVEGSSGQVYVVDLTDMGGKVVSGQVRVTDEEGLFSTADIELDVKDSSSADIVVMTLNQPVYIVEKNVPETQNSLRNVLGWNVTIISVRNENGGDMRSRSRDRAAESSISFIAMDIKGAIVSAKEVNEKLQSEMERVKTELEKIYGPGLELERKEPSTLEDNTTLVTVLSVVLALSIVGLVVLVVVSVIRFKKMKMGDSDKGVTTGQTEPKTNGIMLKNKREQGSHYSSRKTSDVSKGPTCSF